jgi:hypothetical protein
VPKRFRLFDVGTVRGYGMHGFRAHMTNHQSPPVAREGEPMQPDFTVDRAVSHLIQQSARRGLPQHR